VNVDYVARLNPSLADRPDDLTEVNRFH
jgi:hypothetical protein